MNQPMMQVKRSLLLVALLCSPVRSQDVAKTIQRDFWRARADGLTNTLLRDNMNEDKLEWALLTAELSSLWRDIEVNQANKWIENSVDAIVFYPAEALKKNKDRYFDVSRKVLHLISSHNKKQTERLVATLSTQKYEPSESQKSLNSEALIEEAARIATVNPAGALKIGTLALSLGFPANSYKLAWVLRRYSAVVANQFFAIAFSNTKAAPTVGKLYGLQRMAFPEVGYSNFPAELMPPANLRIQYLNLLADHLYQRQLTFIANAGPRCVDEAVLANRMRGEFTSLLPQKLDLINQSIELCLAGVKPQAKQLLNSKPAESRDVDDLLKQAEAIPNDAPMRGRLLISAALAATQQKKYDLAIQILEKMTDEERGVDPDLWNDLRVDSAAGLALAEFKDGDVSRAAKTLKDLPDVIRPLGKVTFVYQMSPDDNNCSQVCVDLLNEARKEIVSSSLPFAKKSSYWLNLVKLMSLFNLHPEAAAVFKEAISVFNGSYAATNSTQKEALVNQFLADARKIIPTFSAVLLDQKEETLIESVRGLDNQELQTQLSLEFLKMMLQQFKLLRKELDATPAKL